MYELVTQELHIRLLAFPPHWRFSQWHFGILSVGFLWHYAYWHFSQWRFVLWIFICGVLSRDLLRDLEKIMGEHLIYKKNKYFTPWYKLQLSWQSKATLLQRQMSFLPFKIINWKGMKFAVTGQFLCEETKQWGIPDHDAYWIDSWWTYLLLMEIFVAGRLHIFCLRRTLVWQLNPFIVNLALASIDIHQSVSQSKLCHKNSDMWTNSPSGSIYHPIHGSNVLRYTQGYKAHSHIIRNWS